MIAVLAYLFSMEPCPHVSFLVAAVKVGQLLRFELVARCPGLICWLTIKCPCTHKYLSRFEVLKIHYFQSKRGYSCHQQAFASWALEHAQPLAC